MQLQRKNRNVMQSYEVTFKLFRCVAKFLLYSIVACEDAKI